MASIFRTPPRLSAKDRQTVKKRIADIFRELDSMPLIVESAEQFAREIELDAELTNLKRALATGRLDPPTPSPAD